MDYSAAYAGLVVVAFSGITYLAYKHHSAFRTIVGPILLLIMVVIMGVGVWDVASFAALRALSPFIPESRAQDAIRALTADTMGMPLYFLLMGTFAYLQFLAWLPRILRKPDETESG